MPVSIAPLQSGAHHSRIGKLFKDRVGKFLREQGIRPVWCSPGETPGGRRGFTVALFAPEDKRMDSEDVARALRKSGIGAVLPALVATSTYRGPGTVLTLCTL